MTDRNVAHTEQRKADRRLQYDALRFGGVCCGCGQRPAARDRASCEKCLKIARLRTAARRMNRR